MAGTLQILRTNANGAPAPLIPGSLHVELGARTRLWVGSGSGNRLLMSNDPADAPVVGAAYLLKTGDAMTGPLILAGPPNGPLEAATRAYADTKISRIGDTMTGPLTLWGPPTQALHAATKGYVDGAFLPLSGGSLTGKFIVRFPDDPQFQALIAGTSKGVRFVTTSLGASIDGVDQTGIGTYQQLAVGGSTLAFHNLGHVVGRFAGSLFQTYDFAGTQTGGFDGLGWVLSLGGRRFGLNDGVAGYVQDGSNRTALLLHSNNINYYRNGSHRFENVGGSSYYGQIISPGDLYLAGNGIYLNGAGWPNGPLLRGDGNNLFLRLGPHPASALFVENPASRQIGGFNASGASLSLDGRAVARNDGNYTVIQDGAARDNIFLGTNGNNHYRNAAHLFEAAFGGASYMTVDNGAVTAYRLINANAGLTVQGNVNVSNQLTAGGAVVSNRGDGLAFYAPYGGISVAGTAASGAVWTSGNVDASGNVNCNDTTARGQLFSGNGIFAYTSGLGGYTGHGFDKADGTDPIMTLQTNVYLRFQPSTGNTWWHPGQQCWIMGTSCFNNLGAVGGHGAYFDLSDIRLKDPDTVAPATAGLAEILKLKPVTFKRLPHPDGGVLKIPAPVTETGFVAQDVAEALPAAVREIELPDGPALAVTMTPIIAAMAEAFRELDQRLKTLEGA